MKNTADILNAKDTRCTTFGRFILPPPFTFINITTPRHRAVVCFHRAVCPHRVGVRLSLSCIHNFKTIITMKKRTLLLWAVAATLLAACNNQESVPTVDQMADTPIAFQVGVADVSNRAGYAAGPLTEGAISFYMQTAGSNSEDARYNGLNRKMEYKEGKWGIEGKPLLWMNEEAEVTWCAYYPYFDESQVVNDIVTLAIPTNQAKDGVYDLLYEEGTIQGKNAKDGIDIKLKHRFTKLIVNLETGTELGDVEYESVAIIGLNTQYDYNLKKCMWEGNLTAMEDIYMIKHSNGTTFEAIILPSNTANMGLDVTLTNGRKFYYRRGQTFFSEGQVYTLNVKVGKDKVETSTLSVNEWATDGRDTTLETN